MWLAGMAHQRAAGLAGVSAGGTWPVGLGAHVHPAFILNPDLSPTCQALPSLSKQLTGWPCLPFLLAVDAYAHRYPTACRPCPDCPSSWPAGRH